MPGKDAPKRHWTQWRKIALQLETDLEEATRLRDLYYARMLEANEAFVSKNDELQSMRTSIQSLDECKSSLDRLRADCANQGSQISALQTENDHLLRLQRGFRSAIIALSVLVSSRDDEEE